VYEKNSGLKENRIEGSRGGGDVAIKEMEGSYPCEGLRWNVCTLSDSCLMPNDNGEKSTTSRNRETKTMTTADPVYFP